MNKVNMNINSSSIVLQLKCGMKWNFQAWLTDTDMCLVLELLGPDLRCWQVCFGKPGLSLTCVRRIITQVSQNENDTIDFVTDIDKKC